MSRAQGEREASAGVRARFRRWEVLLLFLVVVLAAVLRFYRLDQFPPGLHYDEAYNGFSARQVLETGHLQIFFPDNMGEEPLHIHLVAAALVVLGQAPWVIRLVSALCGVLTVVFAWWLGREMSALDRDGQHGPAGWWLGLGTALVLAILYWHLSLSRMGMEPITVPLLAVLAFALLCRALNTGRLATFALAGLALGGSVYTYKAGYFVPVLAALFVAYGAVAQGGFLRRHARGLLLMVGVALLAAAPLAGYFAAHPEHLWHRPGDVVPGAAGAPETSWLGNLGAVLGMFFVRGDVDPRNNLPGRPALDPFLAILFIIGMARAAVDLVRGRLAGALALLWLVVMSVPTLITVEAPHFRRGIGATVAVALLCAMGAWTLWELARAAAASRQKKGRASVLDGQAKAHPQRTSWQALSVLVVVLLAVGLLLSTLSTIRAYFVTWGQSADVFFAYDVGLVDIAHFINELPSEDEVYLSPTGGDHFTLRFLVRRRLSTWDGRAGTVYPPPGSPATVIVQLQEDAGTLPALQRARPDGAVTWTMSDPWGRPYAAAYRLPARKEPAPVPGHVVGARLGDSIELLGYSLEPDMLSAGQPITLTLFWQADEPPAQDYTVFAHVLGPPNPASDGPVWAGHDSQPDGGHYPTSVWQPGETILDVHRLTLPPDAPAGDYQIEVGLYLLESLERLPASGPGGERWPGDAVILRSFVLQSP